MSSSSLSVSSVFPTPAEVIVPTPIEASGRVYTAVELPLTQEPVRSKGARFKEFMKKAIRVIYEIAKVIFIGITSVLFYLANPSLFALGFLVGLIIDQKVRETVEKVELICRAKPWVVILVGVGSFLALPVAVAAGSFCSGAYLSSKIASSVSSPPPKN